MKKGIKIFLIVLVLIIVLIVLDTLQARIFKHSPILSIKEELRDADSYVDRGILMDTFYCTKEEDIVTINWTSKFAKFTCPIE